MGHMKNLTAELVKGEMGFQQMYDTVSSVSPENPLEQLGMEMKEFDLLLSTWQSDPAISDLIQKIMKIPTAEAPKPGGKILTPEEVIKVYRAMAKAMEGTLHDFMALSNRSEYDHRHVIMVAQVAADASVQRNLSFAKEDWERSIMIHQQKLMSMEEFGTVNMQMQQLMSMLAEPGKV